MRAHLEHEVKFAASEDFELPAIGRELASRTFVSSYYDVADHRLARRGITLRYRVEDETGLWQLKLPRSASERIELEAPGSAGRPPKELASLLAAHLRGSNLTRVARLRTRRRTRRVDGAEIVDDSVDVLERQRVTKRFRELEVEVSEGGEATLETLVDALRKAGAEPTSLAKPKLVRALELDFATPPTAAAGVISPVERVRRKLAEQYEQLLAHDPGVRLGTEPEDLHQVRVATRRARAYIRTARPLLDPAWVDALRADLGWLGSALGPARDLDVLLAHLRADVAALGDEGDDAASLLRAIELEREAARAVALEALSDPRYFALLDKLEPGPKVASQPPDASLRDLWWDEVRRTRRAFQRLRAKSKDDELHGARIQVKRARYAAELAADELGRAGQRFIAASKGLQDVLGTHQDACVATERIITWAAGAPEVATTASRLLARERRRRKRARRDWPAAWDALERRARKARRPRPARRGVPSRSPDTRPSSSSPAS